MIIMILAHLRGQKSVNLGPEEDLDLVMGGPEAGVLPSQPRHRGRIQQQLGGHHVLEAGLTDSGGVQVLQEHGDACLAVAGQHPVLRGPCDDSVLAAISVSFSALSMVSDASFLSSGSLT